MTNQNSQPTRKEIEDALLKIESLLNIQPPMGANELTPQSRFRSTIIELQRRICPKMDEIIQRLRSNEADLATILSDIVFGGITQIPVPISTIAVKMTAIGLERFCSDPALILEENSGQNDEPSTGRID